MYIYISYILYISLYHIQIHDMYFNYNFEQRFPCFSPWWVYISLIHPKLDSYQGSCYEPKPPGISSNLKFPLIKQGNLRKICSPILSMFYKGAFTWVPNLWLGTPKKYIQLIRFHKKKLGGILGKGYRNPQKTPSKCQVHGLIQQRCLDKFRGTSQVEAFLHTRPRYFF